MACGLGTLYLCARVHVLGYTRIQVHIIVRVCQDGGSILEWFLCVHAVSRGKRNWKQYYAYLKGFLLYFGQVLLSRLSYVHVRTSTQCRHLHVHTIANLEKPHVYNEYFPRKKKVGGILFWKWGERGGFTMTFKEAIPLKGRYM